MNNTAIILAAGSGTRMNYKKGKLLMKLGGMTILERTVRTFCELEEVDEVIVVCKESDLEEFENVLSGYDISYCFGGDTRQQSVMNAVETIDDCDYLIIHDGARPLVTKQEIINTLKAAQKTGAAAVGVKVKDTIKVVDDSLTITDTPNRDSLIAIHTPQIFSFDTYTRAVEKAKTEGKDFTDDCKLVENLGERVKVVLGEYTNLKITTPEDIFMAQSILIMRGEVK